MIVVDDRCDSGFDCKNLYKIADSLTSKEIELILVDDDEITKINREFRGKDSATDVLSFPLLDMPHSPLGTIVISIDKVRQMAIKYGHSQDDELSLLFIHGLLHLLGYDHERDDGKMREKEQELIKRFNLPDSLIVRSK